MLKSERDHAQTKHNNKNKNFIQKRLYTTISKKYKESTVRYVNSIDNTINTKNYKINQKIALRN